MFTLLYKILLGWLMPPGCFVILFFYCAWKTRLIGEHALRKKLRTLAIVGAIGLYLLSIQPVLKLLASGLENKYPVAAAAAIKQTNVVVVLSAGIVEDVPVSFSQLPAAPGTVAVVRLSEGVRLYRQIKAMERSCVIILTGGRFFGSAYAASEVSREWLMAMAVPGNDIRVETSSRTTYEEARSVLLLLQREAAATVFLVTSAAHMPRAVAVFRKFGMTVTPASCDFSSAGKLNLFSFLPSAESLRENRAMLWEYIGAVFYKLKGK